MRFAQPDLLWLVLLLLPVLALSAWLVHARRTRALRRFAGRARSLAPFLEQVSVHRRATKLLLFGLGLSALLLSAARPQWGARLEPVTRAGVDVVVLLDNSLSMAAEDVAPSRLGYARHAIDSLLKRVTGDRVALITFAGQASLVCPLTPDHAAVRLFLDTVEVEAVQVPGTALAEALTLGLAAFGDPGPTTGARSRALVVFSDGEDHEGGLEEALKKISRSGVTVYAVGCGTTRGAPIPLATSSGTPGGYKKDREGRVVTTRLDEAILELLALDTGGRYYRGTATEVEIEEIAQVLRGLDAEEYATTLRARYEERFQWPLTLGLVALLIETALGDRRWRSATARFRSEGGR